jgi:hypothetical protein
MIVDRAGQAEIEDRFLQPDQPGDGREQNQPQDEGKADPEPADPLALSLGQLVRQDRDEDEVVDSEHDLHHQQGDEGGPGGGIGEKGCDGIHEAAP